MPDEKIERIEPEPTEHRSAAKTLYDGAMAFGAATGGLGTLGLGAAAIKQTFATPKDQPQQEPKKQAS